MTRSLIALISRVVRSHLGHVLLAISWSFILFVILRVPSSHPKFVTCVPIGNEIYTITAVLLTWPIWIVIVSMSHFPAILTTMAVTKLLQTTFSLSCLPTAKVEIPLFFFFSAIQWLLVGYIIELLFRRWRSSA